MSQDPEAGSKDEQYSKVYGTGTMSADKKQTTCLGCFKNLLVIILLCVKNLLGIILLCVALLCFIIFGGTIMLVLYYLLITMIVLYHKTGKAIARAIRRIKTIKDKEYIDRLMNVTAMILDVTAIILDPLFFYILVLDDEKKCIHWDKTLGITATVIRSVLDFLKLGHFISHSKLHMAKGNRREKFKAIFKGEGEVPEDPMGRMRKLFLIDCLAILPIPQVLVIFGIRGPGFSTAMTFFVLQYSLRVIRTYFLFTHATRVSGILADATWAIFAFYLLLYLQSGHMFGALWYYYAIEKATECWREACKNHTGCSGHSYFSCNKSSRDYNFLNDFCRISTGSTTSYSFGIYNDALQSGIVGETDFPKKLIRCLRWGLQNLRFAVFYMAWIMITVHVIRSVTGSLSLVQVYFVVLFASMYSFFFPQFSFILFFVASCIL